MRALIGDKWQGRIFCQRFWRRTEISISQVGCVEHDVWWKRLDLTGARVVIANVAGKHVGNTGPTWRNVLPGAKSFGNLSIDFRHRLTLHQQFADTQDLWQDSRGAFCVEANGFLIQRMIAVDDAGEAVGAFSIAYIFRFAGTFVAGALPETFFRACRSCSAVRRGVAMAVPIYISQIHTAGRPTDTEATLATRFI